MKIYVLLRQYPSHKTERWDYMAAFSNPETAKRVAVENDYPVSEVEWEFQNNRGHLREAWYTEFQHKPLRSISLVRYLVLADTVDFYGGEA